MAKFTNSDLANVDLSSMTVAELKNYIRQASDRMVSARNSRYKAVAKSYEYISVITGTKRTYNKATEKYETRLVLGFSKSWMKKGELLKRARLLQGHFRIDVYTRNAKKYRRQVTSKMIEDLYQRTGIRFTEKEFNDFKAVSASIRDIIEKFGSDNVAKMFEYTKTFGGDSVYKTNLGSILRQVYEDSEGLQKRDLVEKAYKYIDWLLGTAS